MVPNCRSLVMTDRACTYDEIRNRRTVAPLLALHRMMARCSNPQRDGDGLHRFVDDIAKVGEQCVEIDCITQLCSTPLDGRGGVIVVPEELLIDDVLRAPRSGWKRAATAGVDPATEMLEPEVIGKTICWSRMIPPSSLLQDQPSTRYRRVCA